MSKPLPMLIAILFTAALAGTGGWLLGSGHRESRSSGEGASGQPPPLPGGADAPGNDDPIQVPDGDDESDVGDEDHGNDRDAGTREEGGKPAEDPLLEEPVVTVNGEIVTLGHLEADILRREGHDAALELARLRLNDMDWAELKPDDVVLSIGGWEMTRDILVAQLLEAHASKVREELIDIVLVEQALREEGVFINEPMLDLEMERMERRFHRELAERDQPLVPFADFLRQREGMTVEEWRDQPAFRMLAGLHALVFRRAEIDETTLEEHFAANYERFARGEQVDISCMHIPYQLSRTEAGPAVTKEEENRVLLLQWSFYNHIHNGETTFAEEYRRMRMKVHDPKADDDGRIGWVERDGDRGAKGARIIPEPVMAKAFAAEVGNEPVLLHPVPHERGVDLVMVHGRRGALEPGFEEVRERVRKDYLEEHLVELTNLQLRRLRDTAEVDYRGLGNFIQKRRRALGSGKVGTTTVGGD